MHADLIERPVIEPRFLPGLRSGLRGLDILLLATPRALRRARRRGATCVVRHARYERQGERLLRREAAINAISQINPTKIDVPPIRAWESVTP